MSYLSPSEKEILKAAVQKREFSLFEFIEPYLGKTWLDIDMTHGVKIKYSTACGTKASDEEINQSLPAILVTERAIYDAAAVCEYLVSERYVWLCRMPPSEVHKTKMIGAVAGTPSALDHKITDATTAKILFNHANAMMIPLGKLHQLAANNFVSTEEQRFRFQQKATITAIAVSILIGVAGIGMQCYQLHRNANRHVEMQNMLNEKLEKVISTITASCDGRGGKSQ